MRLVVCGGRDFFNRAAVYRGLDLIQDMLGPISLLIEGGQRTRVRGWIKGGADFWGERWAIDRGVPHLTVEAEWARWGKAAGPIRNGEMLRLLPDMVAGFPGGDGTADMLRQACEAHVPRVIFDEHGKVVPQDMQGCK
jgi:hypothetical protein